MHDPVGDLQVVDVEFPAARQHVSQVRYIRVEQYPASQRRRMIAVDRLGDLRQVFG